MKIDGWTQDPEYASFEHIIPISQGGKWVVDNLVLAHTKCNNQRQLQEIERVGDFQLKIKNPTAP